MSEVARALEGADAALERAVTLGVVAEPDAADRLLAPPPLTAAGLAGVLVDGLDRTARAEGAVVLVETASPDSVRDLVAHLSARALLSGARRYEAWGSHGWAGAARQLAAERGHESEMQSRTCLGTTGCLSGWRRATVELGDISAAPRIENARVCLAHISRVGLIRGCTATVL